MITILYVEPDEPQCPDIAKRFLESNGDFVSVAQSRARWSGNAVDIQLYVIVSDYQMPNSRAHLLDNSRLRQQPRLSFLPGGREDIASDALNSGADFYLQKKVATLNRNLN